MKLNFKEKTLLFRFVIWLDRGLNILTGGSFQECLSTRTYILSENEKGTKGNWTKVRDVINWMFWENHCRDSFEWEMKLKQDFIDKYTTLLDDKK